MANDVDEIHCRHILLAHAHEARDIEHHLKAKSPPGFVGKRKSFEDFARHYSLCSSSDSGGDLGLVRCDRLEPEFRQAALSLAVGEISQPIRTRFGYHLILRLG